MDKNLYKVVKILESEQIAFLQCFALHKFWFSAC